ncbi:hypothetical protein H310_09438 [Aphanomyces invadans]|uniref:Thaumatin-like protein n=1 Tax=Aphanomyces invadans TaxID=157072 RepID=A0A024TW02_9STRA|nr:hypothetical protein H310_09438 [Aphanomyces invadans]ETV97522.1 hypothetical protein H310_09438 [Aphanomyces invadans]|eukprot:XP_008873731.1 hypothetical protein H310_09438 [Aphanomyces invadans]
MRPWPALFVSSLAMSVYSANFEFHSRCMHPIDIYDNAVTCTLQPHATGCGVTALAPWSGMFRHGRAEQATLAEFSVAGGKVWYDISTVPPGSGTCTSLVECMRMTSKVGFNVPMSIFPKGPARNDPRYNCAYVVCYANGCRDAYQYPSDDTKTKSCPDTSDFVVTFCPDLPP